MFKNLKIKFINIVCLHIKRAAIILLLYLIIIQLFQLLNYALRSSHRMIFLVIIPYHDNYLVN